MAIKLNIKLSFLVILLLPFWAVGQNHSLIDFLSNKHFNTPFQLNNKNPENIFKTPSSVYAPLSQKKNAPGSYLEINETVVENILSEKPSTILINIPQPGNSSNLTLQLIKVDLYDYQAKIINHSDNQIKTADYGVHYQGVILGYKKSLVAISFLPDMTVAGLISGNDTEIVIGKMKNTNQHIIYNPKEINAVPAQQCFTSDTDPYPSTQNKSRKSDFKETATGTCETIGIYYELDYELFLRNGSSIQNTISYFSAVFNQVKLLYANEEIDIEIAGIKIWDQPDPYRNSNNTFNVVNNFRNDLSGQFPGHLATFISGRYEELGGGVAYDIPENLCIKEDMVNVCAIQNTFENIPTYSWTVFVIAHEMGHILGSPHTHWCGWDGGPIDNCSGYTESESEFPGCSIGSIPSEGGTIMSYCHLQTVGINFSLGFGEQPGNLIRSKINSSSCIIPYAETNHPDSLWVYKIRGNTVELEWDSVTGTQKYQLEYKRASDTVWSYAGQIDTTRYFLENLAFNTEYSWRVRTNCSDFISGANFITQNNILEIQEPLVASSFCKNSYITLDYSAKNFIEGNQIIIELSDPFGNFSDSLIVGSVYSSASGVITAYLPSSLEAGINYKFRLRTTLPVFTSESTQSFSIINENQSNFLSFYAENATQHDFKLNVSTSQPATVSYIVVVNHENISAPSSSQIVNGKDKNNLLALKSGIIPIEFSGEEYSHIINGLFGGIDYVIFATLNDTSACQKPIVATQIRTPGSNTIPISCSPYLNCTDGDYINDFNIPGIGLFYENTGCSSSGYANRTSSVYVAKNNNYYPFFLKLGRESEYIRIWIDSNNDGIFTENELAYTSGTNKIFNSLSACLLTPNITGFVRMRVMVTYFSNSNPCFDVNSYGEAEDFMLYLTPENVYLETQGLISPDHNVVSGNTLNLETDFINASNQINSNAIVDYTATHAIEFLPGFISMPGSVFKAEIKALCPNF